MSRKRKAMNKETYNKYVKELHNDIIAEELSDDQIWDLAKNIVDPPLDVDGELVKEFLQSEHITDIVGRLADDIAIGHH